MLNQSNDYRIYVCPICKKSLQTRNGALDCQNCKVSYPLVGRIPDFILEDLSESTSQVLRGVASIDRLAPIYESKWWYPLVLILYGGLGSASLEGLVKNISGLLETVSGQLLDVACGPGTFGRRIASPAREVYGIDISMGMLRQGMAYAERDHIPNIRFARAKVENLPFGDGFFDGAVCGGALHLFADTLVALKEIARTLKAGASLAVFTFMAGDGGILRFRRIREHVRQDHGIHIFEIPELEGYLKEAGFEMFRPEPHGSVLTFRACKRG